MKVKYTQLIDSLVALNKLQEVKFNARNLNAQKIYQFALLILNINNDSWFKAFNTTRGELIKELGEREQGGWRKVKEENLPIFLDELSKINLNYNLDVTPMFNKKDFEVVSWVISVNDLLNCYFLFEEMVMIIEGKVDKGKVDKVEADEVEADEVEVDDGKVLNN